TTPLKGEGVARFIAQQRRKRLRGHAVSAGTVLLLLLAWEIAGYFTPKIFLSPFHDTLVALYLLTLDGTLVLATLSSLAVLFIGLAISAAFGTIIGLLMGRYERAQWVLEPYV